MNKLTYAQIDEYDKLTSKLSVEDWKKIRTIDYKIEREQILKRRYAGNEYSLFLLRKVKEYTN